MLKIPVKVAQNDGLIEIPPCVNQYFAFFSPFGHTFFITFAILSQLQSIINISHNIYDDLSIMDGDTYIP